MSCEIARGLGIFAAVLGRHDAPSGCSGPVSDGAIYDASSLYRRSARTSSHLCRAFPRRSSHSRPAFRRRRRILRYLRFFLITQTIYGEVQPHDFSLLASYERRASRILPAVACVLAFTLVVASFVLLPLEFAVFGRSLVAASLFASNLFFIGYSARHTSAAIRRTAVASHVLVGGRGAVLFNRSVAFDVVVLQKRSEAVSLYVVVHWSVASPQCHAAGSEASRFEVSRSVVRLRIACRSFTSARWGSTDTRADAVRCAWPRRSRTRPS
jgi:hypothetical protein